MARGRPPGQPSSPESSRSTGRTEVIGLRSARNALAKGEPFKDQSLAQRAQANALDRYELEGTYELVRDNASRIQAVADLFWYGLLYEQSKQEPNLSRIRELSRRLVTFLKDATKAWVELEELRRSQSDDVIDAALKVAEEINRGGEDHDKNREPDRKMA